MRILLLFLCGGCSRQPLSPSVSSAVCVEQIIEPKQGYRIANLLRSYDGAGRIVDERLTDLDPRHELQSPCYSNPSGYTRTIHTWAYDGAGRTVADRFEDLGDGGGCGGKRTASETEKTWDFDGRGLLSKERSRLRAGTSEEIDETRHAYDARGLVQSSVFTGPSTSSVSTWSYDGAGQPLGLEFIYTNNAGERFLSSKSWEYDGAMTREIDRQNRPLDGSDGFFRVELRIYKEGKVSEEWIDHHEYAPNSSSGPYGADGIYDSHSELEYDGAGQRTRERLIHDFRGGIVDEDTSWTYDAEGRVTRESRLKPGYSDFGSYDSKEYTYGPFGIVSAKGFDADGRLGFEVQYTYDAAGRLTRTSHGIENAYEYDGDGRLVRWRSDSDGNGEWDDERRYSYACGVDFTHQIGRDVPAP